MTLFFFFLHKKGKKKINRYKSSSFKNVEDEEEEEEEYKNAELPASPHCFCGFTSGICQRQNLAKNKHLNHNNSRHSSNQMKTSHFPLNKNKIQTNERVN